MTSNSKTSPTSRQLLFIQPFCNQPTEKKPRNPLHFRFSSIWQPSRKQDTTSQVCKGFTNQIAKYTFIIHVLALGNVAAHSEVSTAALQQAKTNISYAALNTLPSAAACSSCEDGKISLYITRFILKREMKN